jgi:cytosine/adenosine deaminase-related metal-dependent hydrolase
LAQSTNVYRARWLITAGGETLTDAAVACAGGRILRMGPWSRLAPHVGPGDTVEHFPDGALVPGFVNAHTHLSLSDMAGKFRPTRNFAAWIGRLALRRHLRTDGSVRRAVEAGARASLAAGTTAGADLTADGDFDAVLGRDGARWTVFGEVFLFAEKGLRRLAEAVAAMEALARAAPVRVGLSPHTPYTAGPEVFTAARRAADERGWPISTHLHETLDEIAFAERGEGPLHDWLTRLGLVPPLWPPPGVRPIRMLAEAGFFARPVLVAHANYLLDEEIEILAKSRSSVAFCPRSHAFFKHRDHPWRRLLAAGVNVCLGTDSLASSPSLSVLDEARFLFSNEPDADPRTLLAMATARGARALGLEDELGDLRPGLAAALCAVSPLPRSREPLAAILAGEGSVQRVARP